MKIFVDAGHAWDKRQGRAQATAAPLSPAAILEMEPATAAK